MGGKRHGPGSPWLGEGWDVKKGERREEGVIWEGQGPEVGAGPGCSLGNLGPWIEP